MPKTKHIKYQRVKTLANVYLPEPGDDPADYPWNTPAVKDKPAILELGCGRGEHSLKFAAAFPEALCIGLDLKSHRLCSGGQKGMNAGLGNLFFLRARVEDALHFFREGTIREIWLTFPDPHPKQRGIKRRLSAPGFLAIYSRLLVPGGKVNLKTDSQLLYTYTLDMVNAWGGQIEEQTSDLHGNVPALLPGAGARDIVSAFEAKARHRGDTVKFISFTLNGEAP